MKHVKVLTTVVIIRHETTFHMPVSNNEQVFGAYITNDDDRGWLIPLHVSLISLEFLGKTCNAVDQTVFEACVITCDQKQSGNAKLESYSTVAINTSCMIN